MEAGLSGPAAAYLLYCFDAHPGSLGSVVAEVTNTLPGEWHAFAVPQGLGEPPKALHVAPSVGMDHVHACRAGLPRSQLGVRIDSGHQPETVFEAHLQLRRHDPRRPSLNRMTPRCFAATVRVLFVICWHALGLRLAGAPVFVLPEGTA